MASLSASADSFSLIMPIEGPVVREFDPGESRYSSGHRGIDIRGWQGQQVRAAASGKVYFAGKVAGRSSVSVEHNNLRTTYTPVTPLVSEGDYVSQGQIIGLLEAGHCFPACLHWGLTDGLDYFNPLLYLTQHRIRLLPWKAAPSSSSTPQSKYLLHQLVGLDLQQLSASLGEGKQKIPALGPRMSLAKGLSQPL